MRDNATVVVLRHQLTEETQAACLLALFASVSALLALWGERPPVTIGCSCRPPLWALGFDTDFTAPSLREQ